MGAVDRAIGDAEQGHFDVARQRLKGYLVDRNDDLAARALLAEYYRAEGYLDEAGRWGYFGGATPEEIAAFEHQSAHGLSSPWAATYILGRLRWTGPLERAPASVQATLNELRNQSNQETAAWYQRTRPLRTLLKRALEVIGHRR